MPDLGVHVADLGVHDAAISARTAWRAGEVRPTHRPKQRPERHWRTRTDPFETAWPLVAEWLEAEPEQTALQLLERLQSAEPEKYDDRLLRTLQRRLKEWRADAARRLVFGSATMLGASSQANAE